MRKDSKGLGGGLNPGVNNTNWNINFPYSLECCAERNFSIPLELRMLKQWGIASAIWNQDRGKYEKFPFQINGQPAKSNDTETWTYFHNVRNAEFLAFFFNRNYTGLDFDNVIHSGKVDDWVLKGFVEPISSYTEVSISGNGLHIILKDPKPNGLGSRLLLKDGHSIEIYDSLRFFLLTGNVYEDYKEIKTLDQISFFSDYIKAEFSGLPIAINPGTAKIDREEMVQILTPYWAKADGRRNDLTLAIAGFIARSGGTEDDAIFVISELCRLTGKGCDHVSGARYAFHREGKIRGFTKLKEIMEELEND